jgi:hypothetical protein
MVEHGGGELAHERLCLKVQVSHHGVAVPATQHMNCVVVNFFTQESHGAARSKGLGANVAVMEACLVRGGYGSVPEGFSDILGLDSDSTGGTKI